MSPFWRSALLTLSPFFLLKALDVEENPSCEEVPVEILYRKVKKSRNKEVSPVKMLWKNYLVEGATWDAEANMKFRYLDIFAS